MNPMFMVLSLKSESVGIQMVTRQEYSAVADGVTCEECHCTWNIQSTWSLYETQG